MFKSIGIALVIAVSAPMGAAADSSSTSEPAPTNADALVKAYLDENLIDPY